LVGVDPSGVIRFVNRQSESVFGYGRDDLIGAPIEMLVRALFVRSRQRTWMPMSQRRAGRRWEPNWS
jgi:PAS domain S-box-containing protein